MSAKSDALENEVLDVFLRNQALTLQVATVYAALFTSNPGEDASGAEVTGGSYARTSMAFDAAAAGTTQNTSEVTFPTATAAWGDVTHFAIFDASTTGNMLYYGALTAQKTVANGDTFKFPAGDLEVSEA